MFERLAALFAHTGKEGLLFASAVSQYSYFKMCGAAFFSVTKALTAFTLYASKPIDLIPNYLRGGLAGVAPYILTFCM